MMRRSPLKRGTSTLKRTPFKHREPRKRVGHNAAMRNACRGQQCYLAVPGVCLGATGAATVVPCHSNSHEHGKGMGLKADDIYTVPGCMACHQWLDQGPAPKQLKRDIWELAYSRWQPVRDRSFTQKNNPASVATDPGLHSHNA